MKSSNVSILNQPSKCQTHSIFCRYKSPYLSAPNVKSFNLNNCFCFRIAVAWALCEFRERLSKLCVGELLWVYGRFISLFLASAEWDFAIPPTHEKNIKFLKTARSSRQMNLHPHDAWRHSHEKVFAICAASRVLAASASNGMQIAERLHSCQFHFHLLELWDTKCAARM